VYSGFLWGKTDLSWRRPLYQAVALWEETCMLSEREQRLLEQMEQALYAEDPKFASALRGADLRSRLRRRIAISVLGFLLGVALLMTGAVTQHVVVSILGFVVMLAAAFFALTSWRRLPNAGQGVDPRVSADPSVTPLRSRGRLRRSRRTAASRGTYMERLEERWRRRRDEGERGQR
jgi:DUF3040 family protein